MAYSWSDTIVGLSPVTQIDDVQRHPIGTRARAFDPLYGEGEFIYMPGVASVVTGDVCLLDSRATGGSTTRAVAASRGPLGVAMGAIIAGVWGWFQVQGSAVVKAATVVAGTPAYLTATAGTVDDAVAAGQGVDGMVFKTADGTPSAGFAVAQIAEPSASGAF